MRWDENPGVRNSVKSAEGVAPDMPGVHKAAMVSMLCAKQLTNL